LYKLLESGKITYVINGRFQEKEDCDENVYFEEEEELLDESNDDNDIYNVDIKVFNYDIFVDTHSNNEFV